MTINGSRTHPIDSRQLLSFATVAKTRSFTQAGKELSLSQSAISHAVKALEVEIGQALLDRNGKNLQITPAGEHLLHYAEKILADMSVARSTLEQRMRWGTGRLRLGTNGHFCSCLLPGILLSFQREFPNWPINVKTGDTRQCVEWLEQEIIDVAIVVAPNRVEAVEVIPLFTDEVFWIVAPSHPWALAGTAATADLESQNFICTSAASYTSQLLEKHLSRDGIRLKCVLEVSNLEVIKEMVRAGAGITKLAEWTVRKELDEKSLVALPLGKKKLKRNWCLLRSPDRRPSLAEDKFAAFSIEATKAFNRLAGAVIFLTDTLWQTGLMESCILSA
jgi:DNA-binding transcriptional LysR family regulator